MFSIPCGYGRSWYRTVHDGGKCKKRFLYIKPDTHAQVAGVARQTHGADMPPVYLPVIEEEKCNQILQTIFTSISPQHNNKIFSCFQFSEVYFYLLLLLPKIRNYWTAFEFSFTRPGRGDAENGPIDHVNISYLSSYMINTFNSNNT